MVRVVLDRLAVRLADSMPRERAELEDRESGGNQAAHQRRQSPEDT